MKILPFLKGLVLGFGQKFEISSFVVVMQIHQKKVFLNLVDTKLFILVSERSF